MAWNRPKEGTGKREEGRGGQRNVHLKGLIAGAIVVLGAAITAWVILSGSDNAPARSTRHKAQGTIREVKPAVAEKPAATNAVKVVDPNARPTRVGEKLNGYVMLASGRLHKILGEVTNDFSHAKSPYASCFHYSSEVVIADLLSLQPGEGLVGTPMYNGKLTANFLKSIIEPIIINEDDPEDVKEMKRAVREAKIELKAAYDRGEDIEDIILKTREDFQNLAQYKSDLAREVREYAKRGECTEADLDDYIAAADKMLEARGIAPLNKNPMIRIKLKMKEKWENAK